MVKIYYVFLVCFLSVTSIAFGQSLEQEALQKIEALNTLISEAEQAGIDAYKEKMTVRTAEIFLGFANWDEANIIENTSYFNLVEIYKDSAAQMATKLPDFERQEVIIMLDEAIGYLTLLMNGHSTRKHIPQVDWTSITHQENELIFNDRPVFLADYTWKPSVPNFTDFHGNQDGFYISPSHIQDESGVIRSYILDDLNNKPTGSAGFIFLNNNNIPEWAKIHYGDNFYMREDTYTAFDIDHPGAKEMMGFLLDGTVPFMAGKKYSQLGYMLCNEPHFFTQKDEWATGPVSNYTIDKFKIWLAVKHQSIDQLNEKWNQNFTSFDDVTITIPIDGNLRGSPVWYDWASFNMYRVTAWYQFVKGRIRESDPTAKVHLKLIPGLWSDNWRDHGIDLEALTEMSEIIGNDAGALNNHMWGPTEWWEENYSFSWRSMTMSYDFMKSVSPDKIFYNSEAHYLSKGKSRDLYQKPDYARATYWMAHTFGMNVSQTWFWARKEDGSIRSHGGNAYAGSNNQQPRIVHEVASTLMDLNSHSEEITAMQQQAKPLRIFYSKTSAINKTTHMDDVFELYESLFFEGISLGFVTKDIIEKQDNLDWEAILIYETEFVTWGEMNALRAYLDNGGTIIKDSVSLTKNEYGNSIPSLDQSNGTIINLNEVSEISIRAMALIADKGFLPNVSISETNASGSKGCHWKCVKMEDGKNVLSIINIGNTNANININLDQAHTTYCKDLLNGISRPSTLSLSPNELLFIEVSDTAFVTSNLPTIISPDFSIYPNPSNGHFKIDFLNHQKNVHLSVYNDLGKLILNDFYSNVRQIQNDISDQPSGSYVVKIKTDKELFSHILIKH